VQLSRSLVAFTLLVSVPALAQEAPPPPPPPAETPAAEPAPAPPPALEQKVDEIDQRSRIVDRKIELLEEAAAARKATDPVIALGEKGFSFKSGDGLFTLKIGAILQLDGRQYLGDKTLAGKAPDTFLARKARPVLQATFFDVADLRLMPEFGNASVGLWDAYVDLRPLSWFTVRGGKFKTPLALQRYQSEAAVVFPERAFPTTLAPNRDAGFEGLISVLGGAVTLEGGVFNGNNDNSIEDLDVNHAKDFAGRLFVQPWKTDPHSLLANLGFGLGASTGNLKGTAAIPGYRSPGQQTYFTYLSGTATDATVYTKGRRTRWSPQGYFYAGPFGLLGEFIQERVHVIKGTNAKQLEHQAWQVEGEFVLGGKPLFEGVQVDAPFQPSKQHWGALELAVRYQAIDFDDATFPIFADPNASATAANAFGLALNWHWSRNIKLSFAYDHTRFDGGGAKGADRKTEHVIFERIQGAF
jgi:phosphate-selective porin OprO/OprP